MTPSSDGGYSPLSVALVWKLPLCPNGQEHLWTARSLSGHHQYGRRVGANDRSHREATDRLQQRLRKCAGGHWRAWTLFRRRHHARSSGQTGRVQRVGRATKNLNHRGGELKSKHDALTSFQVFAQSVAIPSDFRVERLRVDKGGEFISKEFWDYCLQTGVSLECASTNTPQQNRHVGTRWKNSCSYGAVCDGRQWTAKFSVGRIFVHGSVSGQQGAALCDRHAVFVQNATRDEAGSETSSSHRCPGLRAY